MLAKSETKVSKLKGIKPEAIEKRLKLFLFGIAGVGKTIAALQFPEAYIIDAERGCENYGETIAKSGSVVFQSNDFEEIKNQIEALLTEEHNYKTLIIDPVTILYQAIQDIWTRRFEKDALDTGKAKNADMHDFGLRYWGKVKSDYKALQRLLLRLDMNVIVIAHQKDVFGGNMQKVGVTFDSMRGDDYFFDYVFRLELRGQDRVAVKIKERSEIGKNKFPDEFPWNYQNFLKFYGAPPIQRKAVAVPMATKEQIEEIEKLIDVIKIADADIDKWFVKADVDDWHEMTGEQIQKCIDFCTKKLNGLKGGEKK